MTCRSRLCSPCHPERCRFDGPRARPRSVAGFALAAAILAQITAAVAAEPTVFADAGSIRATLDQFRTALGGIDNRGQPGSQPSGRREIDWDAVPDEFAAPNLLPADYFNAARPPRARGAVLFTPSGTGVQVSADSDNPAGAAVRFGHINPLYSDSFRTFSAERLFSPVGSNVVNMIFFVPGTQQPAAVNGFGAVYTDVDQRKSAFEYFDRDGRSLGRFKVPRSRRGLSFLGVVFDQPVVARVQITYGNVALGPDDDELNDVAVMDNFIYGEPQPIAACTSSP